MQDMIVTESMPLGPKAIQANINAIQRVMKECMKSDVHYGKIPGCGSKPTLYKAGSEIILATFRIAVDPVVEDLSTPDEARYRVKTVGTCMGHIVGTGVGECSSNEEKYKWRKAICDGEFQAAEVTHRRDKFTADGKTYQQVRTNPADIANTVLKMAKKRSQIDLTLTATAASDCFTQDIVDGDEETIDAPKAPVKAPQAKAPPAPSATPSAQEDLTPPADGVMTVIINVAGIKKVENKNKPGTFNYYITAEDGVQYSTFDAKLAEFAEQTMQVSIDYVSKEYNGKFYNNVKAVRGI